MGLIIALHCKLKVCTSVKKYLQLYTSQKITEIGVQKQMDENMTVSENVM